MQYANVYNMKNLPRHESQFEPCYAKFTSFPPKSQFHPQTTKTTHQGTFNFHIVQLSSLSITCYGIHDLHFGANGSSHLGTIYHGTTSCVGQLQTICGLAVSCHRNHTVLPTKKEKVPTSSRNSAQEFSHTIWAICCSKLLKKCFLDQKTHLEKLITFAPAVVTNPCHDWTIRGDSIRGIRSHGLLEFVVGHCLNCRWFMSFMCLLYCFRWRFNGFGEFVSFKYDSTTLLIQIHVIFLGTT